MAVQAVPLRTQIVQAINLLRSGGVSSYDLLFGLECSGEDSPEMHLVREVCDEMAVTDAELVMWQQSYLTFLGKAAQSVEAQLEAGTLTVSTLNRSEVEATT